MKKICLIIALVVCTYSFGQKFTVTPTGLKDSSNTENSYLVFECNNKTPKQLYDNAIKYINENYKSPNDVIKGKTEGEYLRFETYVSEFLKYNNSGAKIQIECRYTTELRFKDGKVKYEITAIDMPAKSGGWKVKFSGGLMSGYIIYKKNGKLYKPKTKLEIENYFNANANKILKFLKGENKTDDW